ncbi:hypothetical protein BC827DRAFT_1235094 [Russula dissimulans]|nr:hypothetical protein BC827DRAFT_1235094 [Russula dissimulans]
MQSHRTALALASGLEMATTPSALSAFHSTARHPRVAPTVLPFFRTTVSPHDWLRRAPEGL